MLRDTYGSVILFWKFHIIGDFSDNIFYINGIVLPLLNIDLRVVIKIFTIAEYQ